MAVKLHNLQLLQTEKLLVGSALFSTNQNTSETYMNLLRRACRKQWALRSKIGLKVRDHKSPLLISFANTIHLPPSVNTNLYRDGMKQLLNQQALVASLEGAYTYLGL